MTRLAEIPKSAFMRPYFDNTLGEYCCPECAYGARERRQVVIHIKTFHKTGGSRSGKGVIL